MHRYTNQPIPLCEYKPHIYKRNGVWTFTATWYVNALYYELAQVFVAKLNDKQNVIKVIL